MYVVELISRLSSKREGSIDDQLPRPAGAVPRQSLLKPTGNVVKFVDSRVPGGDRRHPAANADRLPEVLTLYWDHVDLEAEELLLRDAKTGAKTVHQPVADEHFQLPLPRSQNLYAD